MFSKSVIILGLLAICGSCSKEVTIELPQYIPELVVDGTIETDKHPIILLSRSADIYSSTDLAAYISNFVLDANVSVVCDADTVSLELFSIPDLPISSKEKLAEMLRLKSLSDLDGIPLYVYSSNEIQGEVNKTYELIIDYKEKLYSGQTTIPNPTPLDTLFWKLEPETLEYGYSWAILSDPINQFDGYKWEVKRTNVKSNGLPKDDLFKRGRGGYFDDEYFDGITFEFDYENPMSHKDSTHLKEYKRYYRIGDTVVVKFSKMDKQVFDFYDKKFNQIANSGNPFATPVNAPSNLSDGALGVWAGYSPIYDTLYCYP